MLFGHFHNSTSVDIFNEEGWIIYWADANGNYDQAHFTRLKTNVVGNTSNGIVGGSRFTACIAHLVSDTVDDLVLGYGTDFLNYTQDSNFLILFKGGTQLAEKDTAFEDTSANFGYLTFGSGLNNHDIHICLQGDFRGIGREDLLIYDNYDLFFYANDKPFSLGKLARAMRYDTLSNDIGIYPPVTSIAMHLFPKKAGDQSMDFATSLGNSNLNVYLFRGGPDFGSHRITLDSAAYVILPPDLGYPIWPRGLSMPET